MEQRLVAQRWDGRTTDVVVRQCWEEVEVGAGDGEWLWLWWW